MLARGGSKGVSDKNIRLLNGRPLIYYTIKAVQKSGLFDRFILSTDSQKIADTAREFGVEVPFLRPPELAKDESIASDAICHALDWVEKNDKRYDYVQYIFPTSPLRKADDILKAANLLFQKKSDLVISVCETDHPAAWMNTLPDDLSLKNFVKREYRQKNRQVLPKSYRINGSIYIGKWDVFSEQRDWFDINAHAYEMPPERSVDIDTMFDFKLAELLMKENGYG